MKIENLTIEYDGHTIRGLFYMPDEVKEKYPLVVTCHGGGSKYEWMMEYAKQYCEAGACVAIYDFCGGGPESRSSGTTKELSVLTEVRDAKAVLDYYTAQDFIDKEKLFIFGESMGGMVATIVAAERTVFKAVLLLYPAYSMPDGARKQFASKEDIPDEFDTGRMVVSRMFYADSYDLNPDDYISRIECPVFVIHGDEDKAVPLSYSEKAMEVFPDAQLVIFPGKGHGFEGQDIVDAAQVFTEFLKTQL